MKNTYIAGCKINLGLHIVRKRADGYHDLETVFYPTDFFIDRLTIESCTGDFEFECHSNWDTGPDRDNLCVKAFNLLKGDYHIHGIRLVLEKNIPIGAGLGGGSSDAACVLKAVAHHCGLAISQERLLEYAAQLGSDVPFFILNKPAFATGRGEQLQEIPLNLQDYRIEIVKPNISVSTAEAYRGIVPREPSQSILQIIGQSVNSWKECLSNDFEETVFAKFPELADIKKSFYERGALYAAMSGSGSAIFGIFEK